MLFVPLGAVRGLLAAGGAGAMSNAPAAVARVAVEPRATAKAAHQMHQRIGPATVGAATCGMRGSAMLADRLDSLEQSRVDRSREARRLLLLVGLALVADRSAGIQRVGQDLGESGLGQAEFVG
ncbi:MAG: hypothetical protein ACHQ01_07035 [Candidatus Limnocylindrales bacterium]